MEYKIEEIESYLKETAEYFNFKPRIIEERYIVYNYKGIEHLGHTVVHNDLKYSSCGRIGPKDLNDLRTKIIKEFGNIKERIESKIKKYVFDDIINILNSKMKGYFYQLHSKDESSHSLIYKDKYSNFIEVNINMDDFDGYSEVVDLNIEHLKRKIVSKVYQNSKICNMK